MPDTVEQPVVEHAPQGHDDTTLKGSTRARILVIPSDYIVLQESDYNIGAENDPKTFSQAMTCNQSMLWYNAMKEEMNSIALNGVWDLSSYL